MEIYTYIYMFMYVDVWTLIQLITRQGKKNRGKITQSQQRLAFAYIIHLIDYYTMDEHIVTVNVVYRVKIELLCDVLDSSLS